MSKIDAQIQQLTRAFHDADVAATEAGEDLGEIQQKYMEARQERDRAMSRLTAAQCAKLDGKTMWEPDTSVPF